MKRHSIVSRLAMLVIMLTALFAFSGMAYAASYAPAAVTGFDAKPGEFKAKCTWNKVAGAHGYVIYYKDTNTGKLYHTAPITNPNTISYAVTGLTNNHKYQIVIHAYRYIGGKYYYSTASAKKLVTPYLYQPGKPMMQIGDIKSQKVKLTWKSVFGATSYQLFILQPNGKYKLLTETSKTYATVKSLTNDQHYTFALRCVRRARGEYKISKVDTINVWIRTLNAQVKDINDRNLYTGYMNRTVTAKRINGSGSVTITAGTQIGIIGQTTTIQLRSGIKCVVKESDFTRTHNMFDEPRAGYGKAVAEYYVNHWKNSRGQYTNKPCTSNTNYLLWANPYTEHTYVFKKKSDNTWVLLYSWNCITGRYENQSEYGIWKIVKKVPVMYFPGCHANYGCLFTSDGNAFHSLRFSSDGKAIDSANFIGKAASAGCIRLEMDDIKFIYYNIPIGTKVVIH